MKRTLPLLLSLTLTGVLAFGQGQPPNIDFEEWETLTGPFSNQYEEPVDWNTSNECTEILNQFSVTKSTDAHSGTYSVRMETLPAIGNIRANGVITTSQMICLPSGGGQEGGVPFTEQFPDSLVGWYKYAPVNGDSAYAQIMFLSNNDQDTLCFTRLDLHAASDWTRFSVPVCPGVVGSAEKLSLLFNSSWGDGSQGQAEIGSVLYIDAIQFTSVAGIDEAFTENTWTVYPNPVQNELNVQVLKGHQAIIEVLDMTGKSVLQVPVNDAGQKVDVSGLINGMYLYQIRSTDASILRTGKLLVNH